MIKKCKEATFCCKKLNLSPCGRNVSNSGSGNGSSTSSCTVNCIGVTGPTGAAGATGASGLSAYEIAVENGFVGTEQEWLESLVGPTGPNVVAGSIIPYSASMSNFNYNYFDSIEEFYMTCLAFGQNDTPDFFSMGFPYSISPNVIDGSAFSSFAVTTDTTITGLTAEFYGNVEVSGVSEGSFYIALLESPPLSNIFTFIPESETKLNPNLPIGVEAVRNAAGISSLNYNVVAGTKIMCIVYVRAVDRTFNDLNIHGEGFVFAGMSIKETV